MILMNCLIEINVAVPFTIHHRQSLWKYSNDKKEFNILIVNLG